MTEISDRYRKNAASLTKLIEQVPPDAWEKPSPCEGWKARDVIRHVVETTGWFLDRAGGKVADGPSPDDDPLGAWTNARDTMQKALDDPAMASTEYDTPMGRSTLEQTVGTFGVGDLVVHAWDLARATGLDERLDPDEVHRLYETMKPNDEMLRQSGVFGPKVDVPDDADEQTKLIAFTGRTP
jgi:uncharacterized protein (TIGR03086 family)